MLYEKRFTEDHTLDEKNQDYVRQCYEGLAAGSYHQFLDQMGLKDYKPDCILDLGTGPGQWLAALNEHRPQRLVGADASPAMLIEARRQLTQREVPHQLVQLDAQVLPFQSATFDFIVSNLVLPLIISEKKMIGELARICKPGGKVLVTTHGLGFYLHKVFKLRSVKYLSVPIMSQIYFWTGIKLFNNTYQTYGRLERLFLEASFEVECIKADTTFWNSPYIIRILAKKQMSYQD